MREMSRLPAILLPFVPALALAAEGHRAVHHGIPWGTLIFSTINVLIFFFILKRFVWPAATAWVKDRRSEVVTALEDASRAKAEAEGLKQEWEKRLASLGQEIEGMRRQARVEIDRERGEILAAARKAADSIRDDARRLADHEVLQAHTQLRQEVAKQAVEIARQLTSQRLTTDDHARFVDEFLNRVNA